MPRDLLADKKTLAGMSKLSRTPETVASPEPVEQSSNSLVPHRSSHIAQEERLKQMGVRPYSSLLNVTDLDDCDWLEHAAFDPIEAATREKLEYRLQTCGELCSGLFSSAYPTNSGPLGELIKTRTFPHIDSSDSDRKRVLLAHIISTKAKSPLVTDDAMDYPKDWKAKYQLTPSIGHNEDGQTVCLHSLCVHPHFARKGLGMILLKSYTQRIKDSGVATRIALICRERYIPFYEKAGFKKVGPSKCQYGGGNWVDMVLVFEQGADDGWDH
ncbi:polyamine acetyltransferase [Pyrenophora seminiperda CCB06]|uniref:Polyamine acetyltransferase n=1 Tax=Pyrenophora seminiperda CCB06 TaxID=1302712 RepID=A0A3M7MGC5_9PLEO|nr:polyamine acetyltransferase [Pyrenophora seminiperda CCB06]